MLLSPFFTSCLVLSLLPAGLHSVPLEDFFPFGNSDDAQLAPGSTAHMTINIPLSFVFYEEQYQQLHVSASIIIIII